jgi:hypothetical protein
MSVVLKGQPVRQCWKSNGWAIPLWLTILRLSTAVVSISTRFRVVPGDLCQHPEDDFLRALC